VAYSQKTLDEMKSELAVVNKCYHHLLMSYSTRKYKSQDAKEYALHGFLRRLKFLSVSLHKVFNLMPPERKTPPKEGEEVEATINLQSFFTNVAGCTDNLARVWVLEKQIKQNNGKLISKHNIGLGPKNHTLRKTFSREFQNFLEEITQWFDFIKNYRDALAHRIPLYIPPYTILRENHEEYKHLERRKNKAYNEALIAEEPYGHDLLDRYDSLGEQQKNLGVASTMITHSFTAYPIPYHNQLLIDFKTVVKLGEYMLKELDTL